MLSDTNPVVSVVSSLVLKEDQIRKASELITAMQIGVHKASDIKQGYCQLVHSSHLGE